MKVFRRAVVTSHEYLVFVNVSRIKLYIWSQSMSFIDNIFALLVDSKIINCHYLKIRLFFLGVYTMICLTALEDVVIYWENLLIHIQLLYPAVDYSGNSDEVLDYLLSSQDSDSRFRSHVAFLTQCPVVIQILFTTAFRLYSRS